MAIDGDASANDHPRRSAQGTSACEQDGSSHVSCVQQGEMGLMLQVNVHAPQYVQLAADAALFREATIIVWSAGEGTSSG